MINFRKRGQMWCLWPARPVGLIEFLGGSYLSSNPQVSYNQLLQGIAEKGIAINSWSYIPGFDHQSQANEAWKCMRKYRTKLEERVGPLPKSIRLGHSLGCKLHLLAPDGGRNSDSLIALSFNNFAADKSIPFIEEISFKIGIQSEFSPNPRETMEIISHYYCQSKNLLIRFEKDNIDQTKDLFKNLQNKSNNNHTKLITMKGNHLTPVSYGFRKLLLGNSFKESIKSKNLVDLINKINEWSKEIS